METAEGVKVKAQRVKETSNMVRYEILPSIDRMAVGSVYVNKQCLPTPFPAEIEIIIK